MAEDLNRIDLGDVMATRTRTAALSLAGIVALVGSLLGGAVVAPAALAEERLPAIEFRPCTSPEQVYCVESVTFEVDGFPAQQGVWVPTGEPIPAPPVDDTTATPDAPPLQPTSPTISYPGRWSFPEFPVETVAYDGVFVQVGPASTASDVAWVRLNPASARADGTVGRAVAAEGSTSPRDLDAATKTTVVVRFGPLEPTASILVADGRLSTVTDAGANTVTFAGYPVVVPRAKASADCREETGVALDRVRQQYAFVVFGNTRQSFGYDGMTGGLSVSTNGTCFVTTPTYNPSTGAFTFQASAPHFAPDGVQVNRGFYIATIPMTDAELLFGITHARQVRAILELSVENEDGIDVPVQYSVAVRRGVISVSATNFQFSRPTFTLKVKSAQWKKKYKKAAAAARKAAAATEG